MQIDMQSIPAEVYVAAESGLSRIAREEKATWLLQKFFTFPTVTFDFHSPLFRSAFINFEEKKKSFGKDSHEIIKVTFGKAEHRRRRRA